MTGALRAPLPVPGPPPTRAGRARKRKGRVLPFTVDACAGLPGPEWLRRRRAEAFEDFESLPLPSEKEEVWRYSPIDQLDLGSFDPVVAEAVSVSPVIEAVGTEVAPQAALVVVAGGRPVSVARFDLPDQVIVSGISDAPDGQALLGRVLTGGDALVRLNDAVAPQPLVIDVPAGVVIDQPIVVVHHCPVAGQGAPSPAWFPRTFVRVGDAARASVVEVLVGADSERAALVVPVTEVWVGDGGELSYVALQELGGAAWHIGRLAGRAGSDAVLSVFTAGLGGAYDRSRIDAVADGTGAHCELRSAYLGTGEQVHDVRTQQEHRAARTTSDLLCKGAVAGSSRSVYSGLIKVVRGAVKTEAFQTNHNLVLDPRAHADSVPNLDIEENDVRCSHASTVGPVDEDQLYYLESRGVSPERAERLIVLGFFDDVIDRLPVPAVAGRLRRSVGALLDQTWEVGRG
jgi:Fe-S cluster assembly protein SufD